MNSRRQLFHRTVLDTEGLTFNGTQSSGDRTKHAQFGLRALDKVLRVGGGVGGCVAGLSVPPWWPARVTALQLCS